MKEGFLERAARAPQNDDGSASQEKPAQVRENISLTSTELLRLAQTEFDEKILSPFRGIDQGSTQKVNAIAEAFRGLTAVEQKQLFLSTPSSYDILAFEEFLEKLLPLAQRLDDEVMKRLYIAAGHSRRTNGLLMDNIDRFSELSLEIAEQIAGNEYHRGGHRFVREHKNSFSDLPIDFWLIGVSPKDLPTLVKVYPHFPLSVEDQQKLINTYFQTGWPLEEVIAAFHEGLVDDNILVQSAIQQGTFDQIDQVFDQLRNLRAEAAIAMIDADFDLQPDDFGEEKHFSVSLDLDFANQLIGTHKRLKFLARNLEYFHGLNKTIALKIIEEETLVHYVLHNADSFSDLDSEIALHLIEAGHAERVLNNLEKFHGTNSRDLLNEIADKGHRGLIAKYYELSREYVNSELPKANQFCLILPEYHALSAGKKPVLLEEHRTDKEKLFNLLIEQGIWTDEQNIIGPFRDGVAIFGYEKMFTYLNPNQVGRHDALHAFRETLELMGYSGLNPSTFYGNILQQVVADSASYEAGVSHHHLNEIVQSFNSDVGGLLAKAQRFSNIPHIGELAEKFSTPQAVFASWINLKRYHELSKLLERAEILEQLKDEKNEKLRNYVAIIALHPDSAVDMQAALQFWREPGDFLQLSDAHTPEEIHERKKPSNLTQIPHLNLDAYDLRDALVEGALDKIQVFTPMEIEYVVSAPLVERAKAALGSRREGIVGQARNPQRLFAAISKVLKQEKIAMQDFLGGAKELPENAVTEIEKHLADAGIGLPENVFPSYRFIAKINEKSDPQGVLAGNDTACCMPFGSGKNNVYTWNPNDALFTLQLVRDKGRPRTIAQSVLTKDVDIGKLVPEIINSMNNERIDLNAVLSEEVLADKKSILAADNVEVSPNYRNEEYGKAIAEIYRDFFKEYVSRYATLQNFETSKMVIGTGFSDTLSHLPTERNVYVPRAPVGYSDKTGDSVFTLELKTEKTSGLAVTEKKIVRADNARPAPTKLGRSVSELTFEDVLPVSYIEGKAYAGNQSLLQYLWGMENTLIAKDISNSFKGRPNMSFKYESGGKTRGYLLGYEGTADGEKDSESVLYVADLAVKEPGSIGGARAGAGLIQAFAERYKAEFLDKGKLLPIMADTREQTSYKLITRELDKVGKKLGVEFELEERGSYERGGDTMHSIVIRPKVKT